MGAQFPELERVRKKLPLERAAWCASELRRSANELQDAGLEQASQGTRLMAETLEEISDLAANQARIAEQLARGARFLLDMLQLSNEEVEALYGRSDTLEQAAIELRGAIQAQEDSR